MSVSRTYLWSAVSYMRSSWIQQTSKGHELLLLKHICVGLIRGWVKPHQHFVVLHRLLFAEPKAAMQTFSVVRASLWYQSIWLIWRRMSTNQLQSYIRLLCYGAVIRLLQPRIGFMSEQLDNNPGHDKNNLLDNARLKTLHFYAKFNWQSLVSSPQLKSSRPIVPRLAMTLYLLQIQYHCKYLTWVTKKWL